MKKIIVASLCLISAVSMAQTQDKTKEIQKDTPKSTNILQKEQAPSCPANCVVETPNAKVVKKTIKKKKVTPTIKTQAVITPVEDKGVILGIDTFHIPAETNNKDLSLWEKPLKYSDIDVKFNYLKNNDAKQYFYNEHNFSNFFGVQLINKKTNEKLDVNSLTKLPIVNKQISLLTISTDLKSLSHNKIDYSSIDTPLTFNSIKNSNGCTAFVLSYQLKTEAEPINQFKFLDKDNNIVDLLPENCLTKDSQYNRETTFYTNNGNIINIGINTSKMIDKKLSFTLHTSKNGREFFGADLESFAFNRDMSKIVFLNPKFDTRGPFFGVNLENTAEVDDYNVLVKFISENNNEIIKFKTSIH